MNLWLWDIEAILWPQIFWETFYTTYKWTGQEKILGQKVNVKIFTLDPFSVGTGVPRTFLELGKIQKNIFLKIKRQQ